MRMAAKRWSGLAVLVAGLLAVPQVPDAHAAEPQVTHSRFKGNTAAAHFTATDASGCLQASVVLSAADDAVAPGSPPPLPTLAFVGLDVTDTCNELQLVSASGQASLIASAFRIKTLDSAVLNATVEVFDHYSGNSFPVELTLKWTGFGAVNATTHSSRQRSPGFFFESSSIGRSRQAFATGTLAYDTITFTLANTDPTAANISSVKSGQLIVKR